MTRVRATIRRVIVLLRPLMVTPEEAAQILRISRSQVYELEAQGVVIGTRALGDLRFSVESLRATAARLVAEEKEKREAERQEHLARRRPFALAGASRK